MDKDVSAALIDEQSKLWSSGKLSDLLVMCGTQTWNVHRAIICARSRWFEKAYYGGFKEAQSQNISIEEKEPFAIAKMLKFIYTLDYNGGILENVSDGDSFSVNVEIYKLANYFDVPSLRTLAMKKLSASARKLWQLLGN